MQRADIVHVNTPDRGTFQVPWQEAVRLASTQELGPNANFWFEGQAEWMKGPVFLAQAGSGAAPYGQQPAPYVPPVVGAPVGYGAPAPMAHQWGGAVGGVKALTAFAVAATMMIGIYEIFEFVAAGFEMKQIQMIDAVINNPASVSLQELEALDAQVAGIALFNILVYLVAATAWCVWKFNASKNVRAMGAQGFEASPGLAVGSYFIPFANLYLPFKAMSEIARASQNPMGWKQEKTPGILYVWWGLWLFGNIVAIISTRMMLSATMPETLKAAISASVFSTGITAMAAVAAMAVCWKITKLQEPHASR